MHSYSPVVYGLAHETSNPDLYLKKAMAYQIVMKMNDKRNKGSIVIKLNMETFSKMLARIFTISGCAD